MKVYKFGGASVRNADGVRNLVSLIGAERDLLVVVSAMGKTTNALERVFEQIRAGVSPDISAIAADHQAIIDELWGEPTRLPRVEALWADLAAVGGFDEPEALYDAVVSFGELVSTTIISEYLTFRGVENGWLDMRRCFRTDDRHKDATVSLVESRPLLEAEMAGSARLWIGQGFIGSAPDGTTTTLGREGSDYSAAVAANLLDAESMAVWKDVDGIMNADPKRFPDAVQIAQLNYLDTIELAYSGAQIIHPKTIKPLQQKNIPLYVRPFGDKRKPGTVIRAVSPPVDVPILILKGEQELLTIRPRDFSFVLEEKFAQIFALLEDHRIRVNLIQNSAVNLTLCVNASWHLGEAVDALRDAGFDVMRVREMELLTIRGYTAELLERYGAEAFLTQSTRTTARIVRKKE